MIFYDDKLIGRELLHIGATLGATVQLRKQLTKQYQLVIEAFR